MPKLLLRNAVKLADRAAMREKKLGIWQTYTWANVLEEVRAFSLGLRALGLKRDDTIALLGDNRPRLYWTFAAAQALGAIPVPVYQDSVAEELIFVLSHAEVTMAVVENQEQVDKLLSIADRVPTLRAIVYDDPRGLLKYNSTLLHSYDEVRDAGRDGTAYRPRCRRMLEVRDRSRSRV